MKKLIKSSQIKRMPWKNGLGVTSEIDIYPDGADLAKGDFHWRLGSAQITSKNSFSNFPGYDRWLVVLSGAGLKLNDRILQPFEIYQFSGEEKMECSLLDDAVEDFGIIYDRKMYQCEMAILEVHEKTDFQAGDGLHFLKPISSNLFFDKIPVDKSDTLKTEGPEICEINSKEFPAQFLKVSVLHLNPKIHSSPV